MTLCLPSQRGVCWGEASHWHAWLAGAVAAAACKCQRALTHTPCPLCRRDLLSVRMPSLANRKDSAQVTSYLSAFLPFAHSERAVELFLRSAWHDDRGKYFGPQAASGVNREIEDVAVRWRLMVSKQ